jgi:murein DD-endopeptidase MepM/ murein hydrolase activator NlpD
MPMSSSLFSRACAPTARFVAGRYLALIGLLLAAGLGPPPASASSLHQEQRTERGALGDAALQAAAVSGCEVLWASPVDAPITDGYRPPSNPYGPGNRGLEFGTESGDPVRAVASGTVRFAGSVGNSKFVTVEQPSGLRATYGFVEDILVAAGQGVETGDTIAIAGPAFHLTARVGARYRDPTPLLEETCYRVRLVPVPAGVTSG